MTVPGHEYICKPERPARNLYSQCKTRQKLVLKSNGVTDGKTNTWFLLVHGFRDATVRTTPKAFSITQKNVAKKVVIGVDSF